MNSESDFTNSQNPSILDCLIKIGISRDGVDIYRPKEGVKLDDAYEKAMSFVREFGFVTFEGSGIKIYLVG